MIISNDHFCFRLKVNIIIRRTHHEISILLLVKRMTRKILLISLKRSRIAIKEKPWDYSQKIKWRDLFANSGKVM